MNNFLPSSSSRQETHYREWAGRSTTLHFLHHDMEKSGPHEKKKKKSWDSFTWGKRERDVELMSQAFCPRRFPLGSKNPSRSFTQPPCFLLTENRVWSETGINCSLPPCVRQHSCTEETLGNVEGHKVREGHITCAEWRAFFLCIA